MDEVINRSPLVRCAFITQWHNKKATFCPSVAHEGIGTVDGDEDDIVFYCSHHRRVVEAKRTIDVNEQAYLHFIHNQVKVIGGHYVETGSQ